MKLYKNIKSILLKLFIIVCPLLLSFPSKAQNQNLADTLKKVSGNKIVMKTFYENKKVKEVIVLKNQIKHGKQKKYYDNGVLQSLIEYNNGKLCGKYLTYNRDGNPIEIKSYSCKNSRSQLQGKYLEYEGNVLLKKGYFKDSLMHGTWVQYYPNGILKSENNYKNGELVGEQKYYNNKGNLNYKNSLIESTEKGKKISVKHGAFVTYHNNGNLSQEGNYEYDKKSGLWREYNPSGLLYREIFYKNGKIHGQNNLYTSAGKPELISEFYEEIEIEGIKLNNVYHGLREKYKNNGKIDSKEVYHYGKKEGTWESFHTNGVLSQSNTYKNNLQTGVSLAFDEDGNKTYEATYEIVKTDTQAVSIKTGREMRWLKKVLVYETQYINGKEQGIRKSYYPNGNVAMTQHIVNDLLQGESIEYYENGKVKSKRNYHTYFTPGNEKKLISEGWNIQMNEDGTLQNKYFYDSLGNIITGYSYYKGKINQLNINKVLELNYFPNGKLQSEKIGPNSSNMAFVRYYFMNGNIRKIGFQNPKNLSFNTLHFQSNGKLNFASGNFYNKPDTLLPDQNTISSILKNASGTLKSNKFYSDSIKEGSYTMYYLSGKKFAELNFKSELPDGNFVFFHPENGDTMLFAQFKNGLLHGSWLEKYGGRNVWQRGSYCNNKMCGIWTRNQISGKANEIRTYNPKTGQTFSIKEFYNNGLLKSYNNYESSENEFRDEKGNLISRSVLIDEKLKKVRSESYYPNSNLIKSCNYYFDKIQDSIAETYFESGQLQSKMPYKNGKRNGTYYEYFESGKLKRKLNWENEKLEGIAIIVSEKGQVDTLYYKNNNLQIKPSNVACTCIDTSYNSNRVGFAPMLNHLLPYDELLSYMPRYLLAVDSLNYRSVFYTGLQNSNGYNSGFTSMNLMMFKEFAFYLPSNQQIKLVFNPCITKGYISRMEVAASYGIGNRNYTNVDFYPKRIALEFISGPVKSADKNYQHFKALFDTKNVEFNPERKIKITTKNPENDCFVPAVINDLLNIKINKASQYIFEQANPSVLSNYQLKITQVELELFFGIVASDAQINFDVYGPKGYETITAQSDFIMLGGAFACGAIKINCTKTKNELYHLKDKDFNFTVPDIKNALERKGFSRINFIYDVAASQLWFTFYTE